MYNEIGDDMEPLYVKIEKQLQVIYRTLEQTGFKEQIRAAKEKLNQDDAALHLINQYNQLSQNPYDNKFQQIRLELFANPTFAHYQALLNEENNLILEINYRLFQLTKKGNCHENY